jgi:uncharacterized membrane protein YfcA
MLFFFVAYLLCGAFIGFCAGLFGIGGGIIGIPMLLIFFKMQGMPQEITMHMVVGTSLAIVVVTCIASIYTHYQKQVILLPVLKRMILGAIFGSALGVIISSHIQSDYLQRIFAIFLLLIALQMFLAIEIKVQRELPSKRNMFVATTLIGTVSGMLGLGGGVLMVPYLCWSGIPIRNAIGTATACILPAAIVGAIGYTFANVHLGHASSLHTGFIYWPAFIGISITSVLCAPIGIRVAHLISTSLLRKLFSIFLLVIGISMLV